MLTRDNNVNRQWSISLQEAQLSQRDRAMLCVIQYFAKSLKVIQNGTTTIQKHGYGSYPLDLMLPLREDYCHNVWYRKTRMM